MKTLLLTVALFCLARFILAHSLDEASLDRRREICARRTGKSFGEITKARTWNDGCSLECVTPEAVIHTYFFEEGEICAGDDSGRRCHQRKCRSRSQISATSIGGLYATEIHILGSNVPESSEDLPMRLPEPYVTAEISSGGSPAYDQGKLLCETPTASRDTRPNFNFVCKTNPLRRSTQIKFTVYDRRTDVGSPAFLGEASVELGEVVNCGLKKLKLYTNNDAMDIKNDSENPRRFLEVKITGELL